MNMTYGQIAIKKDTMKVVLLLIATTAGQLTIVIVRYLVSEPRYLEGDEFALSGGYEELINCKECAVEFDSTEYQSDTCSECEDKRVMREKASK